MREEREVNKFFFFFRCELQCTSKDRCALQRRSKKILLIAPLLCASFMCSGVKKQQYSYLASLLRMLLQPPLVQIYLHPWMGKNLFPAPWGEGRSIQATRSMPHIILYLQKCPYHIKTFCFYCNIFLLNTLDYIIESQVKISLI